MKNQNLSLACTLSIAFLALTNGAVAQSATIDFEDTGVAVPSGNIVDVGANITSREFTFTSPLNTGFNDELQLNNDFPDPEVPSNGTIVLLIRDGDRLDTSNNIISLTEQGGSLFSLSSLDIAED